MSVAGVSLWLVDVATVLLNERREEVEFSSLELDTPLSKESLRLMDARALSRGNTAQGEQEWTELHAMALH